MSPALISVTSLCAVLVLIVVWLQARHVGSAFMADTVAALRTENAVLRERVAVLETDYSNARIVIRAVQEENYTLRCELDKLRGQVEDFGSLVAHNKYVADNWKHEALQAKE